MTSITKHLILQIRNGHLQFLMELQQRICILQWALMLMVGQKEQLQFVQQVVIRLEKHQISLKKVLNFLQMKQKEYFT